MTFVEDATTRNPLFNQAFAQEVFFAMSRLADQMTRELHWVLCTFSVC